MNPTAFETAVASMPVSDRVAELADVRDEAEHVLDVAARCWAKTRGRVKTLFVLVLVVHDVSVESACRRVAISEAWYYALHAELREFFATRTLLRGP